MAGVLGLDELGLVGGMVLAARGGLTWASVFNFASPLGFGSNFPATADLDQSFAVSSAVSLYVPSSRGAITVTGPDGHARAGQPGGHSAQSRE